MEHSLELLIRERVGIQTEINHCKTLIDNHYKDIERLKKEQISCEIKRRELNQTIDLIKHHDKLIII